MTMECTSRELLIYTIARLLSGVEHVAVGMSSPMPAAGAMLLRAMNRHTGGKDVQVSILGSVLHNAFTSGSEELSIARHRGASTPSFSAAARSTEAETSIWWGRANTRNRRCVGPDRMDPPISTFSFLG